MDIINVYIPQLTYEYIFLHMFRKEAAKCPLTKEQAQECLKILDELQAMLESSESTSGGA